MTVTYTAPNGKVITRSSHSEETRKRLSEKGRAAILKNDRRMINIMSARAVKPSTRSK